MAHEVSRKATVHLANAIAGMHMEEFDLAKHSESVLTARMDARSQCEAELLPLSDGSVSVMVEHAQRGLRRLKEFSTGAWLYPLPSEKNCTVPPRNSGMASQGGTTGPYSSSLDCVMAVVKGFRWTMA